jgi:predicted site-specific integrase-resolvase
MKTHSTQQVAKLVGIHWTTLHRWRAGGLVRASLSMPMNGRTLWRWTDGDVERVRKYKAANYRKGRGRKKKPKA